MRGAFVSKEFRVIGNREAKKAIIFLHGSGGGDEELADDLESQLSRDILQQTKLIFPAAKSRRYTLFGGEQLPVWFDRTSIGETCVEDMNGLIWTVSSVRDLAQNLKREGVEKLVIAGFSQGGCAALYCGYKFLGAFEDDDDLFCAVVCMSSFLCDTALSKIPRSSIGHPPLLYTSNQYDNVVPERLSEKTLSVLKDSNSLEITDKLHCGQGGHWLNSDCIAMFESFLNAVL